jgi:hypothetical protein
VSPSLGHPAGTFFVGVPVVLELLVAQGRQKRCAPYAIAEGTIAAVIIDDFSVLRFFRRYRGCT